MWNSYSVNKFEVQVMECFVKFFIIVDSIHPAIYFFFYISVYLKYSKCDTISLVFNLDQTEQNIVRLSIFQLTV